jgi:hypothetical protein
MAWGIYWIFLRWAQDRRRLLKEFVVPYGAVLFAFFAFYLLRIIPPVPLSLTHVGIYHNVEKMTDSYKLTSTRSRWRFWEHGDQTFDAKPGDRIYCFFSIFAPGGFSETVKVRWLQRHELSGWTPADAVPVAIAGGRDLGYRGFTYKQNFKPGDWQVRIETSDGREVGRIALTVRDDMSIDERSEHVEIR